MLIVYAHPLDEFHPAVLLRALYVATGLQNSIMYIIKRRLRVSNLVRYSRVPVSLFREKVRIQKDVSEVLSLLRDHDWRIVLLSPARWRCSTCQEIIQARIDFSKLAIVVDEAGSLANLIMNDENLVHKIVHFRDRPLYGKFSYDAVSVLYSIYIRDIPSVVKVPSQDTEELSLSELFYLMRHILDSCKIVDNFLILSPRTLIYALRHALQDRGILVDLAESRLSFDHVRGECTEEIVIDLYRDRTLEFLGRYTCTLRGRILEIPFVDKSGRVRLLKFYIDYERGRVYFNEKIYYERVRPEKESDIISCLGTFFSEDLSHNPYFSV